MVGLIKGIYGRGKVVAAAAHFPCFLSQAMNESKNNKGYERKEEKMKKAKMRIIWGIIIVAIAAFLIVRIFRKEEPVAPTPDPVVMVQPPAMGNIELTTNLVGTIEPADIVYIYPKAGGDVTAVNVKAGDTVAAGQVLVEIDTKQVATSKNVLSSYSPISHPS